jgi:hypothetical protein
MKQGIGLLFGSPKQYFAELQQTWAHVGGQDAARYNLGYVEFTSDVRPDTGLDTRHKNRPMVGAAFGLAIG